ncbi:hypothetical protein [Aliiruegeria lutimaris]|uniref:Recombinase domain-containing protein n=1 Tax=Aliiruegeria lutimaris TaxID=571298 RepID=A0A1G9KG09_9RHOB|nr:hypothetical protein [Aliiruegeria lutimaris]SDL48335.1 hypothetical protein SAMN04488026_10888 [Aliiruegeria lutimaris]
MRNAVGFYWTLPVPWAGFKELPEGIEEAAKASRTIRYQCELIRHYAKDSNYQLVAEEVFLEIEPDRGSRYIREPLRRVEEICRANDAVLLYVDFSMVQNWRGHEPLSDWARETRIDFEKVWPDEILIDGRAFDPHKHFSAWRARQSEWTEGKEQRTSRALAVARQLRNGKQTYKAISEELNAQEIRSATGKPWTEESIRKLLGPKR